MMMRMSAAVLWSEDWLYCWLGILERMIAEMGAETKTVATGGLAKLIAGGSKYIGAVDEMLTLTGLRIIYERNMDRHKSGGRKASV